MPFDGTGYTESASAHNILPRWLQFRITHRPDSAVVVLRQARAMIVRPGRWVQGYYTTSDGRRCAVGAIRGVRSTRKARQQAKAALLHIAKNQGFQSIEGFNDRPDRTHDQVLAAFDEAITYAENQEVQHLATWQG